MAKRFVSVVTNGEINLAVFSTKAKAKKFVEKFSPLWKEEWDILTYQLNEIDEWLYRDTKTARQVEAADE